MTTNKPLRYQGVHSVRGEAKRRNREPVVAALIERIASGELGVGDHLQTEHDLGLAFGVSRTVVREVIQDLVALGLIETRPRVGARVLPMERWDRFNPMILNVLLTYNLDASLYEALREARWLIEPEVAAMAAARADADGLARIEEAFQNLAKTVDPSRDVTPQERVVADIALHRAILSACGNWVFEQFGPLFDASIVARMTLAQQAPRTDPPLALEKHRRIVDAIKVRNPGEARRATLSVLALSKPAFDDYFEEDNST